MANTMNNYCRAVLTIEQLNNVPQFGQYEGNILDTFNFNTEEVQEKPQHLNNSVETGIILKTGNQQKWPLFTRKDAGKNLETSTH